MHGLGIYHDSFSNVFPLGTNVNESGSERTTGKDIIKGTAIIIIIPYCTSLLGTR